MAAPSTHPRSTSEQRRAEVVEAAMEEFGAHGLHGATTLAIARSAGISQAYLFQLFGTKRGLFLAACDRSFDRALDAICGAGEHAPGRSLDAMEGTWARLCADGALRVPLHGYAAAVGDEVVRAAVGGRLREMVRRVRESSGASAPQLRDFLARALLLQMTAWLDPTATSGRRIFGPERLG